jgi:hypothetical protein
MIIRIGSECPPGLTTAPQNCQRTLMVQGFSGQFKSLKNTFLFAKLLYYARFTGALLQAC